jgi:hypothetical protein
MKNGHDNEVIKKAKDSSFLIFLRIASTLKRNIIIMKF